MSDHALASAPQTDLDPAALEKRQRRLQQVRDAVRRFRDRKRQAVINQAQAT